MTGWDLPRVALVLCAECSEETHPDCIGPDGACVACWERRPGVVSNREAARLLDDAARAVGATATAYPCWPWGPRAYEIGHRDGRVWAGDDVRELAARVTREADR